MSKPIETCIKSLKSELDYLNSLNIKYCYAIIMDYKDELVFYKKLMKLVKIELFLMKIVAKLVNIAAKLV